MGYAIGQRLKRVIMLMAVLGVISLGCFSNMCNGWYYRYLYPIAVVLQFVYFTEIYVSGKYAM